MTSIGNSAFSGCSGLTSVNIGNSVSSIDNYAFYGCSGLTSVTIPTSVTRIGKGAFLGTGWYENQVNGLLYLDKWLLGYKGDRPVGELRIAEDTKGIAGSAFSSCSGLASVTIPNSLTTIGESAFSSCTGLTSVTIPNSVTTIGESAFFGCTSLTSVTLGDGVSTIGRWAFTDCKVFKCNAITPPTCDEYALSYINKETCKLYVPAGCLAAYEAADQWKDFLFIEEGEAPTAINTPRGGAKNVEHYNLSGQRLSKSQKGINIIRYSDGTTRKVLVK